jgi:hypothetical protein
MCVGTTDGSNYIFPFFNFCRNYIVVGRTEVGITEDWQGYGIANYIVCEHLKVMQSNRNEGFPSFRMMSYGVMYVPA